MKIVNCIKCGFRFFRPSSRIYPGFHLRDYTWSDSWYECPLCKNTMEIERFLGTIYRKPYVKIFDWGTMEEDK